jgi:threonine dehydratase
MHASRKQPGTWPTEVLYREDFGKPWEGAPPLTADDVRAAYVAATAQHPVPLLTPAPAFSAILGASSVIFLNDAARAGSSTVGRGVAACISGVRRAGNDTFVIATNGNAGRQAARFARLFGMEAHVVVPESTPRAKLEALAGELGNKRGSLVVAGHHIDGAVSAGRREARRRGIPFIHPYDDARVVAGNASLIVDAARLFSIGGWSAPDVVLVPAGGGGLVAGLCVGAAAVWPKAHIIACEPAVCPSTMAALAVGGPQRVDCGKGSLADACFVRRMGRIPWQITSRLLHAVASVDERSILGAMRRWYTRYARRIEGAGALPLAAAARHPTLVEGRRVLILVTGANIGISAFDAVMNTRV